MIILLEKERYARLICGSLENQYPELRFPIFVLHFGTLIFFCLINGGNFELLPPRPNSLVVLLFLFIFPSSLFGCGRDKTNKRRSSFLIGSPCSVSRRFFIFFLFFFFFFLLMCTLRFFPFSLHSDTFPMVAGLIVMRRRYFASTFSYSPVSYYSQQHYTLTTPYPPFPPSHPSGGGRGVEGLMNMQMSWKCKRNVSEHVRTRPGTSRHVRAHPRYPLPPHPPHPTTHSPRFRRNNRTAVEETGGKDQ